jgi:hypothetical protein
MRIAAIALAITIIPLAALTGCQSDAPFVRSEADARLFGPVAMRLHPIFTQVKDWTGDNKPDGIEALIELQDQFGDPTKASGRVVLRAVRISAIQPRTSWRSPR